MESLIGIYDDSAVYANRLSDYINVRKDVGYRGVAFGDEKDLEEFFNFGTLSILLTDNPKHLETYGSKTKVFLLSEEIGESETADEKKNKVFKYAKASNLLREVIPNLSGKNIKSNVYTVFSPSSNEKASEYAFKLAEELGRESETLLISWDPFGGMGRDEEDKVSVSELLFAVRKNRSGIKKILPRIQGGNGSAFLKGTDFYSDLWKFSPDEMTELVDVCKTEGKYANVVFVCGFMSESVERLMELSDEICLVKGSLENDRGNEEFIRQMKYAGKQEILSGIKEVAL